jgi:hypothetical protein
MEMTEEINEPKEPKMSEKEFEQRRKMAGSFLNSEFYRLHLEPYIKEQIDKSNRITKINDKDDQTILNDFRKNKNKVNIYRGLLKKVEEWATKSYKGGK